MGNDFFQSQEQVLHLLIEDKACLDSFLEAGAPVQYFNAKYRTLLDGIFHALSMSVKLTRNSYKEFVKKKADGKHQAVLAEDQLFVQIVDLTVADSNDLPLLMNSLKENFLKSRSKDLFDKFQNDKDKDYMNALRNLTKGFDDILVDNAESNFKFYTIKEYFDEWFQGLSDKRTHPETRLLTGIKEIDETMQTGLVEGSLTLFVAEPGGLKSCMMMNIALNAFMDYGVPVLYVSLEMTKEKVMNRIISRETNIELKKISQPDLLSEEEIVKVKQSKDKWTSRMHDFGLIDNIERMTVADIKRIIQKNMAFFKPRLVVIDYIAILQPDERYRKQNEISWAGEMCKDIRQMGRKFHFATVSAVQLGKESLKKLKSQKPGKQSAGLEDMRGSHDYSADADNVYIQWPHPNEPTQKLCVVCAKARDGKRVFTNNSTTVVLEIKPHLQRICSDNVAKWQTDTNDPIYKEFGAKPPPPADLDDLGDLDTPVVKKKKPASPTDTAWI